jgi:inosose dehydratase
LALGRPGLLTTPAAAAPGDGWRGLKVGVASYTLRKLPLDAAIKAIQRVGLSYVSIKDFHLSLKSTAEERKAVVQKFREAGITPLSCGVITMQNDEANIRQAFEYAKDAGIPTIVCSPHPDSLPILDRMVKEYNIRLAIHNHGPEDTKFPGPYDVMKAVAAYDRRIGLCIDVGHTARVKVDPAEAIRKCRERLYDVHLKDLASTEPKAANLEIGRGVLDLKGMLHALAEIKFADHVGIEYEIHADDPIPGLAESVGYLRGVFRGS